MPITVRMVTGSIFTQRMPLVDGMRVVAAETVRHRQAVVEEAEVELAGLQHAADRR